MVKTIIKAFPEEKREAAKDGSSILFIAECFCDTIQGENFTGQPSTFLRLKGCTLDCKWCFGVIGGRRIPRIMTRNGKNKKINKVKKGDVLLTYDKNTKEMVETTVVNTLNRNVQQWREIKTEYSTYFVTGEHPFFTTKGLVNAENLKQGDEILHSTYQQKISYTMKHNNPMFNQETRNKTKENTDYKLLGKKISDIIKKKQKDGSWISPLEYMTVEQQEIFKKNMSKRQMGKGNNNWIENYPYRNYVNMKKITAGKSFKCDFCGKYGLIEIHHKDGNQLNDKSNNLLKICHQCHSKEHKRGENFWNGNRSDGKISLTGAEQAKNGIKIVSNKPVDISTHKYLGKSYGPKELSVFNITCSPHNSYIIDNMWVHNCDTTEVWKKGNPYSVNELLEIWVIEGVIDRLMNGQHLVLTGGSPLLQQGALCELIDKITLAHGFKPIIEIENECVIMPSYHMIHLVDCWNNSPKLKNSGVKEQFRYIPDLIKKVGELDNSWFKFVISNEDDWFEIEQDFLMKGLIEPYQIVLMPEGATREQLQKNYNVVVDLAVKYNVKMTDRLHVTIWNKTVGV